MRFLALIVARLGPHSLPTLSNHSGYCSTFPYPCVRLWAHLPGNYPTYFSFHWESAGLSCPPYSAVYNLVMSRSLSSVSETWNYPLRRYLHTAWLPAWIAWPIDDIQGERILPNGKSRRWPFYGALQRTSGDRSLREVTCMPLSELQRTSAECKSMRSGPWWLLNHIVSCR